MTSCTICSVPTDTDLCPWCQRAHLAAVDQGLPQPWWIDARMPLAPKRAGLRALDGVRPVEERGPFGRLAGLGSMLLGWLCLGYAVAHFVLWTLPRCAWLHTTGRLPLTDARDWRHTHTEDTR